jgi:hypothetical protein
MKKQLYRAAAATVLGLSLTTGIVAADTGNINTTGPGSSNTVTAVTTASHVATNNNNLGVQNKNHQDADSGDASVKWNTTGGSATSGAASNHNAVAVSATINNSASAAHVAPLMGGGSASGSISNTGPGSNNLVSSVVNTTSVVTNNNNVEVSNYNHQDADTGDAKVYGNTTGGSATSGSASNTASSTFSFNISN